MTNPSDGGACGGSWRHVAFHGRRSRGSCQKNGRLATRVRWSSERVLGPGEGPALDVLVEGPRGTQQLTVESGVLLDEGGHPARPPAERVGPDQHLPVALGAGADADRGDHQL